MECTLDKYHNERNKNKVDVMRKSVIVVTLQKTLKYLRSSRHAFFHGYILVIGWTLQTKIDLCIMDVFCYF